MRTRLWLTSISKTRTVVTRCTSSLQSFPVWQKPTAGVVGHRRKPNVKTGIIAAMAFSLHRGESHP